ncbi:MAG: type II secretion system protein [Candidatus Buchananbacteria bacterium]|nr:type II secretion system protein [Candidatus Buchananbacteria bacterium]
MRQKSQKGFSIVDILIVVAVILIIAVIVKNSLLGKQIKDFKESFAVELSNRQPSEEERQIIQPLVTKQLQGLRDNLDAVLKEKVGPSIVSETITPEEVTQRINKLKEIKAALAKAENSAKYFGFKT